VLRLFTDPSCTPDSRVWDRYEPAPAGSWREMNETQGLFPASPEEHTRLRRLAASALTPRAVRRMEWQVREVVEQFAAPLRGRSGVVDLIDEFTSPIPNSVISRITGIPPMGDDERRFRDLAQAAIRGFHTFSPPEVKRRGDEAGNELAAWVDEMARQRRKEPREDLISDFVQAEDADDRLTDEEIVRLVTSFVSAGSETTTLAGTFALSVLLRHPDQLDKLRATRDLLDNAVMEVLRFEFANGPGLPRYALRDFELRGRRIRRGQQLQLSFQGAHRDPRVFDHPERFDVERNTKDVVVFGRGPHYCLGANLARQELRCMMEAALDFLPPGAAIRDDLVQYSDMVVIRRMETLPVAFLDRQPA
jgi:cytochrome P450